jgi:hypothetical protein
MIGLRSKSISDAKRYCAMANEMVDCTKRDRRVPPAELLRIISVGDKDVVRKLSARTPHRRDVLF